MTGQSLSNSVALRAFHVSAIADYGEDFSRITVCISKPVESPLIASSEVAVSALDQSGNHLELKPLIRGQYLIEARSGGGTAVDIYDVVLNLSQLVKTVDIRWGDSQARVSMGEVATEPVPPQG